MTEAYGSKIPGTLLYQIRFDIAASYIVCWQRFIHVIQTPWMLCAEWNEEASSSFFIFSVYNLPFCLHSDEPCPVITQLPQIVISDKLWVPGGSTPLGRRTTLTEFTKGNWEFCHNFKVTLEKTSFSFTYCCVPTCSEILLWCLILSSPIFMFFILSKI